MVIISLFGIFIAIICWFNNLYKIKKTEEVEYWTVSLLSLIDSMIHFISFVIFTLGDDKINIIVSIIISLIGYILLIDVIFFAEKRVRRNCDIYYATTLLEEAGISYRSFEKLSYNEQLQLLKTTPCKFEDREGVLVEDEDDLLVFDSLMNKKDW